MKGYIMVKSSIVVEITFKVSFLLKNVKNIIKNIAQIQIKLLIRAVERCFCFFTFVSLNFRLK